MLSIPAEGCDFDNESFANENNSNLTGIEMTHCQCSRTDLMVEGEILLKWLNVAENHSISKLSTAAHNLKIATEYLQVNIFNSLIYVP